MNLVYEHNGIEEGISYEELGRYLTMYNMEHPAFLTEVLKNNGKDPVVIFNGNDESPLLELLAPSKKKNNEQFFSSRLFKYSS